MGLLKNNSLLIINRAKPYNVHILDSKYYDEWRKIWEINFIGHIRIQDISGNYNEEIWKKISHNNLVWLQIISGNNILAWLEKNSIQLLNLKTSQTNELKITNSSTLHQLINLNKNNQLKFISNQNESILLWHSFHNLTKNLAVLYKYKIDIDNKTIVDDNAIKYVNCNGTIYLDDRCPDNITSIAFPILDAIYIKRNRIFMSVKDKNRIMSFSTIGGKLYQMSKKHFIQVLRHTTSACK